MEERTLTALKIAGIFAGLGIIVSRFTVLQFLGRQPAVLLFLLWYVVLFLFTQVIGAVVADTGWEPGHARVGLAIILLVFAAGIVLYWPTSTYSVIAAGGDPAQVPSFVLATEDEVTYQAWWLVGVRDLTALGILTYGVTPFVLVFLAITLLSPEAVQEALGRLFAA